MKPLIVLVVVFLVSLFITWIINGEADLLLSGKIAMSAMLLLTAIGHFKFRKGMTMMLPSFIPAKSAIVLLTGILEILAAIGLLVPVTQKITGICLVIFFIFILPANMYAAVKKVNFETGAFDGSGLSYLWFRIPLQLFFIFWVYWFVLRS